ncbi:hypothetical protein TNCV_4753781 [Trichonephila clavipes]|nr:hypothetical protein TNCV_4753781 [Trichonephila clavipes]
MSLLGVPRLSEWEGTCQTKWVEENVHIKVQKNFEISVQGSNRLVFHSTGTSRTPDSHTPGSRTAVHVLMGEKRKKCPERRNLAETAQKFMSCGTRCCLNPAGALPILVHDARSSISASTSLTKSAKLQK